MQNFRNQSNKVNLWSMLRDVLIVSMNKGQFPLACIFLIFIILIIKLPGEEVAKLVFQILEGMNNWSLIGYALFGLSLAGWFIHSRWQRRRIDQEMDRLSNIRTKLQKKLNKTSVKASNKK